MLKEVLVLMFIDWFVGWVVIDGFVGVEVVVMILMLVKMIVEVRLLLL